VKPGYLADSGYVAVKLGSGYSATPHRVPTILRQYFWLTRRTERRWP